MTLTPQDTTKAAQAAGEFIARECGRTPDCLPDLWRSVGAVAIQIAMDQSVVERFAMCISETLTTPGNSEEDR